MVFHGGEDDVTLSDPFTWRKHVELGGDKGGGSGASAPDSQTKELDYCFLAGSPQ